MGNTDETFMALALQCAAAGRGAEVEPNPMVGAVIARDGVELARGSHRRFGGPHAEVEALAAAAQAGHDVRGATLYVTLEPCCHFGKTPPCTGAVIRAGIARVVAAMQDPDARVAGQGFAALRQAGIEVVVGVIEAAVRELLAPYVKLRTLGRPWVICKWAQTADGFLAQPAGLGRWISGLPSRRELHLLRSLCDGICVGIGTVLTDDPLLTNRSGQGRQPARVVLDGVLRLPLESQLVRTAGESLVLAVGCSRASHMAHSAEALSARGVQTLILPERHGRVDLAALLDELGRRQWTYLLVEGGAEVHRSFMDEGLADELLVFVAPHRIGPEAGAGLPRMEVSEVATAAAWRCAEDRPITPDRLVRYRKRL